MRYVLSLILVMLTFSASSQDFSPKIQEIIRITMSVDGHLSKEMHKEFWGELSKEYGPDGLFTAIGNTKATLLFGAEYQKEVWASAKRSSLAGFVIMSQRLIELQSGKDFDSPQAKQNTSRLLKAAANKTGMISAQGEQTQIIDLNLINTVLSGMTSSFDRLEQLLNPLWENDL